MALKIDDLLREADQAIEKRASASKEVKQVESNDEVTKLATLLLQEDEEFAKLANSQQAEPKQEDSMTVKIAHALVITEMLSNIDKFNKIEEFEKRASAQGFTQEQINEFIVEKLL